MSPEDKAASIKQLREFIAEIESIPLAFTLTDLVSKLEATNDPTKENQIGLFVAAYLEIARGIGRRPIKG